jgi:hypothetical protein
MRLVRITASTLLFLCTLISGAFAQQNATPTPQPDELLVGPAPVHNDVQGVSITIPVYAFFKATTGPSGLQINARVYADLDELQAKVGALIDKQDLPRNNCRSYSANNPVVTIWGKRLDLSGNAAVLRVSGDVDLWDCRENPIKCSKVEWHNNGPFGTPAPTVRTYNCNPPWKNKLLTQPMTMTVLATMQKVSDTSLRLVLDKPHVELGGDARLSAVRDFLIHLFGVDLAETSFGYRP